MPYDSLLSLIGSGKNPNSVIIYKNYWNEIRKHALEIGTLDEENSTILGIKYELQDNPDGSPNSICAASSKWENEA